MTGGVLLAEVVVPLRTTSAHRILNKPQPMRSSSIPQPKRPPGKICCRAPSRRYSVKMSRLGGFDIPSSPGYSTTTRGLITSLSFVRPSERDTDESPPYTPLSLPENVFHDPVLRITHPQVVFCARLPKVGRASIVVAAAGALTII